MRKKHRKKNKKTVNRVCVMLSVVPASSAHRHHPNVLERLRPIGEKKTRGTKTPTEWNKKNNKINTIIFAIAFCARSSRKENRKFFQILTISDLQWPLIEIPIIECICLRVYAAWMIRSTEDDEADSRLGCVFVYTRIITCYTNLFSKET